MIQTKFSHPRRACLKFLHNMKTPKMRNMKVYDFVDACERKAASAKTPYAAVILYNMARWMTEEGYAAR